VTKNRLADDVLWGSSFNMRGININVEAGYERLGSSIVAAWNTKRHVGVCGCSPRVSDAQPEGTEIVSNLVHPGKVGVGGH
jgi:hypothetical protein